MWIVSPVTVTFGSSIVSAKAAPGATADTMAARVRSLRSIAAVTRYWI